MVAGQIAAPAALDWGVPSRAEIVHVDEALALRDLDVLKPEVLDVASPLEGCLHRPPAADDLRLPPIPMKAKSAKALKSSVRSVAAKASRPIEAEPEVAEKIFKLAAFLEAFDGIQQDIERRRQPAGD